MFDKLVADLDMPGLHPDNPELTRGSLRFYTVPQIERFNETALRSTVRRELGWLLNTTNLESAIDLEPYPEVRTSVLNYGVRDLTGQILSQRVLQNRARHIKAAIVSFECRMDPKRLDVTPVTTAEKVNAVTYIITGDVSAAVAALPVEFKTDIELDTGSVVVRD